MNTGSNMAARRYITKRGLSRFLATLMVPALLIPRPIQAEADTLAFFQEEAKVVTASRREQAISESPVAIDVITAKDIEASGATNLWDLLRFRPGMDVVTGRSNGGNRAIVSVRGFPQEFAGNVLVLIDGRTVYSETNAGVLWEQLPVQMQDIERIEIVRGPNAALFGTGAGLGVINIITRKPDGEFAGAVGALGGNRGTLQTAERVEGGGQKVSIRASHTYLSNDGNPLANGDQSNDYLWEHKGNVRTLVAVSPRTDLDLSFGALSEELGIQQGNVKVGEFDSNFQLAKLTHRFGSGSVEMSAHRNDENEHVGPVLAGEYDDVRTLQHGFEAMHEFGWARDRLHTTYGGSARGISVESERLFGTRQRVSVTRGFASQTVKLQDWWTVNGAFSLENTHGGGTRPAYHVANIFTPADDHALRVSQSVSFTSPSLFNTRGKYQYTPTISVTGNPELNPLKVTSYEVGHAGRYLNGRLRSDLSLFYTRIRDIEGVVATFVPPFTLEATYLNRNNAIARGVETALAYHWSPTRSLYLNHTYEIIRDDLGDAPVVTGNTPNHKVNMGANVALGRGFTTSFNLGYKNNYQIFSLSRSVAAAIPAHVRVDARVAYRPGLYPAAQIFIAGQNLERSRHIEAADGLVVARTYHAGMSVEFGGTK